MDQLQLCIVSRHIVWLEEGLDSLLGSCKHVCSRRLQNPLVNLLLRDFLYEAFRMKNLSLCLDSMSSKLLELQISILFALKNMKLPFENVPML